VTRVKEVILLANLSLTASTRRRRYDIIIDDHGPQTASLASEGTDGMPEYISDDTLVDLTDVSLDELASDTYESPLATALDNILTTSTSWSSAFSATI
jgi:hypothetical protein